MSKNTTLSGIPLYNGTYSDFFAKIENPVSKTLVFTPNPEILVRASRDSEFMEVLTRATYNVPDANGLYIGYMMQEGKSFFMAGLRTFFMKKSAQAEYGELIKGSDLVRDILEKRVGQNISQKNKTCETVELGNCKTSRILIIDRKIQSPQDLFEVKKEKIQQNLKSAIESKYPGTEIYVVFAGQKSPLEIAGLIKTENIEYVFSCVGMKIQEQLLVEVFAHLDDKERVVGLGVGASMDFLLGLQKRAPRVFQQLGLEWLYRLMRSPRKRARRIWDAVYHFPKLIKNSSKD